MKITNLTKDRLQQLFNIIEKCTGSVYLISPDMHINLKSNLAHFVSFANLCLASNDEIEKIEIIAQTKEDIDMLYDFMIDEK